MQGVRLEGNVLFVAREVRAEPEAPPPPPPARKNQQVAGSSGLIDGVGTPLQALHPGMYESRFAGLWIIPFIMRINLCAVFIASLVAAPPAIAQCAISGWCLLYQEYDSRKFGKIVSRNGQYAVVDELRVYNSPAVPDSRLQSVYDCQAGRYRWSHEQRWVDILPGTYGEVELRFACN